MHGHVTLLEIAIFPEKPMRGQVKVRRAQFPRPLRYLRESFRVI